MFLTLWLACSSTTRTPTPAKQAPAADEEAPQANPSTAPVYFWLYSHHYGGKGGYYATVDEIGMVADACERHDVEEQCTLFLDGITIEERLQGQDDFVASLKRRGFSIGYHGEDVHGPYPIIEPYAGLTETPADTRLTTSGQSFDQAAALVEERLSHSIEGVQLRSGSVVRNAGGSTGRGVGGLKAVRELVDRDVDVVSAHGLFFPPAGVALRRLNTAVIGQDTGPFAEHFRRGISDTSLNDAVEAYLGWDTTLMWHMGELTLRTLASNVLPAWDSKGPEGEAFRTALDGLPLSVPTVVVYNMKADVADLDAALGEIEAWVDAHPGSAIVSPGELADLVEPHDTSYVAKDVAQAVVDGWDGGPPNALYLSNSSAASLAEGFEVLVHHLADGDTKVTTSGVLGPTGRASELERAAGSVTASDVRAAAEVLQDELGDSGIPTNVSIGGKQVGFHQALHAMAHVTLGESKVTLTDGTYAPPLAVALDRGWKRDADTAFWTAAQLWTVKPAHFDDWSGLASRAVADKPATPSLPSPPSGGRKGPPAGGKPPLDEVPEEDLPPRMRGQDRKDGDRKGPKAGKAGRK